VRFVSYGKKGFPQNGTGAMDWIQPLTQSLRRVGFPKRPASLEVIVDDNGVWLQGNFWASLVGWGRFQVSGFRTKGWGNRATHARSG